MRPRLQYATSIGVFLLITIMLCFGVTSLHTSVKASKVPLVVAPNTLMPLGDSITYGQGSFAKNGYRYPFWQMLQAHDMNMHFVGSRVAGVTAFANSANEGHPGWRINQLASHLDVWLRAYRPQYILLHIGTNDILRNDNLHGAPARLRTLLQHITSLLPQTTILVAQIIPIRRFHLDTAVRAYNAAIPGVVEAEVAAGYHVSVVDMHSVVTFKNIPDGVHPDDEGYKRMAQAWYNALAPLLHVSTQNDLFLVFRHSNTRHAWNLEDQWDTPKAYNIAMLQQLSM